MRSLGSFAVNDPEDAMPLRIRVVRGCGFTARCGGISGYAPRKGY